MAQEPVQDNKKLMNLRRELADTQMVMLSLLEDSHDARGKVEEYSKTLEQRVKERTYELSVLYEFSQQIGYTLDYTELSHLILTSLHKVVKYDICASFLLNGDSGDLRIKLAKPLDNETIQQSKVLLLDAFEQIGSADFDERNVTVEVETTDDFVKGDPPLKGEIRSFFNVPLLIRDKTMGMINISSLNQDAFTEGHIRLLYTIASQTSVAIEKLQALLKAEKSKIESAIESMADGVIMVDKNKQLVVINPAARKALHSDSYQGRDIDFEDVTELLGYDPVEVLSKQGRAFVKNEVSIHGMDYQAQACSVAGSEGEIVGTVLSLRDVSREKEIDRMKSEFISVASHELRTPLTSIKNAVDLILSGKTGETTDGQEKFLSMAKRNIDRLAGLINDLLDISKIESGKMELHFAEMDMKDCVEDVINTLRPSADEKSISLKIILDPEVPSVYADASGIDEVMINLVGNALKFTPDNGTVTIDVHELKDLPDRPGGVDGFVEVSVIDNGVGIPEEFIDHVFDKFYQVESSLSAQIRKGSGLGLAISKHTVEAHGGSLLCKSKEGEGSTFSFTLPMADKEVQA